MTYAERIESFNRASHSDPLREMQGLYADRLPPREPGLRQLADQLIVASHELRECRMADEDQLYRAKCDTADAFRAAVERATGMRFDQFAAAMGEL